MPELALSLWGAYYLLALGLRVAVHRRRTGRSGLVLMRARPGSAQWTGETIEALALALAVAAPILDLTGTLGKVGALDADGLHLAGAGVFAAGLAGIVISQAAMGASWRIGVDRDERTGLVTGGPFAYVRNPIFTAITVVLAGNALLVPNATGIAALVLFVVSVELQARLVEEPHLARLHGPAYEEYAARTGRFVPGVGRLAPSPRREPARPPAA